MSRHGYGWTPESGLFKPESNAKVSAFERQYSNFGLKQGIIVACYAHDHPRNVRKTGDEYDVLVTEQNKDGAQMPLLYPNVSALDSFGGVADFFQFRRRARPNGELDPNRQVGCLALLLCLDGNSEKAVLVGALHHGALARKIDAAEGNALEWEYNGVNFKVSDDGSFSVTYRSKTKADGTPEGKGGGSQVRVEGDGSVELHTGDGGGRDRYGKFDQVDGSEAERLRLNKTAQAAELRARKDVSISAGRSALLEGLAGVTVKAGAQMVLDAIGSASISALSMEEEYKGNHKVSALGYSGSYKAKYELKTKLARIQAPIIELKGLVMAGGKGGTPAVTRNTKYYGTGYQGTPVMSRAIGPFSTKVLIK
jgi:hypothetical protein